MATHIEQRTFGYVHTETFLHNGEKVYIFPTWFGLALGRVLVKDNFIYTQVETREPRIPGSDLYYTTRTLLGEGQVYDKKSFGGISHIRVERMRAESKDQ